MGEPIENAFLGLCKVQNYLDKYIHHRSVGLSKPKAAEKANWHSYLYDGDIVKEKICVNGAELLYQSEKFIEKIRQCE